MYGILKVYYIILIYSFLGERFFNYPDIVSDVLVFGFVFLSMHQDQYQLHVPRKQGIYFICTTVVPAIVILVYSLLVQLLQSLSVDYIVRSVTLSIRMVLYCFLGLRAVYVFKEKSADTLLCACAIAYLPTICSFFFSTGIVGGFQTLFSESVNNDSVKLEVHRLTYVFGFLAVYYLYEWIILKKKVLPQLLLSVCLLFLGVKRIAIFAFIIAAFIIVLLKFIRRDRKKYSIICGVSFSSVIIALIYIYLIKNGYLQIAFKFLGIEDNFRFNFWNHISPEYDFGLGFIGRGISYSHRFMWHNWYSIKDLAEATNLHNDILSYYIGLGFVGFCLFFGMFFLGQVILSKRLFSIKSAAFATVISLFYFITMLTSNEGMPGIVYGCYMLLVLASNIE